MTDLYWIVFADGPEADVTAYVGPKPIEDAAKLYGRSLVGLGPCKDCLTPHPIMVHWIACLDHEPTEAEAEEYARRVLNG